jgi:hypothetical protein
MALTTDISLAIMMALTKALDLSVSPEARPNIKKAIALATGTGANQADKAWFDQRTIAASATDTLDLAGTLTDALGDALTFARIKALYVAAAAGNTNNVNVVRPASNGVPLFLAAGDGIPVRPGGVFFWVAPDVTGVAVTAGTGDLVDLINSGAGTSVTADIVIIGASA